MIRVGKVCVVNRVGQFVPILASLNVNGSDHRKLREETTEVRYPQVYDDQSRKGVYYE